MSIRVPRKNISDRVSDIRANENGAVGITPENPGAAPAPNPGASPNPFLTSAAIEPRLSRTASPAKHPLARTIRIGVAAALLFALFGLGVYIVGWYRSQTHLLNAARSGAHNLQALSDRLSLREKDGTGQLPAAPEKDLAWGDFVSLFRMSSDAFKTFGSLASLAGELSGEMDYLTRNAANFIFDHRGAELLTHVARVRDILQEMRNQSDRLSPLINNPSGVFPFGPEEYISLRLELDQFSRFVGTLYDWLKPPRRVAVFLQNSSELRPTGGFWGSYAELDIQNAELRNLAVRDINEVDRGYTDNVVPPLPLQVLGKRWRIADANWFFRFADSASAALDRMEHSSIYRNSKTSFDGAMAISPRVVADILSLIGPIQLPAAKVTIDHTNFLREIQREVQSERVERNPYPKQVLGELAPVVLDRLRELSSEEQKQLAAAAKRWIENKDIMLYLRNSEIQQLADLLGLSGDLAELPREGNVDYLAVVASTLQGGKTDLVINQTVTFLSQLNEDGTIADRVEISRDHRPKNSDPWWYKAENNAYFKIYTPPEVELQGAQGMWDRRLTRKSDASEPGYLADPLVTQSEAGLKDFLTFPGVVSFPEADRNVFGVWNRVSPGERSTFGLDYRLRSYLPPADGRVYQLVFDRQSAARSKYRFEISTPIGYRWKENGLPVFEFETDDPPARLVFALTLEKI
ncbi:MAG: DUF4012 domain-containing protein [Candidatus Liptonbacteria bacterium]|nr:DUF4012 domain-containing protein [Candidatus Liptonbacteria bacterium]